MFSSFHATDDSWQEKGFPLKFSLPLSEENTLLQSQFVIKRPTKMEMIIYFLGEFFLFFIYKISVGTFSLLLFSGFCLLIFSVLSTVPQLVEPQGMYLICVYTSTWAFNIFSLWPDWVLCLSWSHLRGSVQSRGRDDLVSQFQDLLRGRSAAQMQPTQHLQF